MSSYRIARLFLVHRYSSGLPSTLPTSSGIREPGKLTLVLYHGFQDIATVAAVFRDAQTQPERGPHL
jgi:hypothetical protein